MSYKLEDLIDMKSVQELQDKINIINQFPSAIVDNNGKLLTSVAWQDVCTKFHRIHPESKKECIKNDQCIIEHLHEANPEFCYKCPLGLIENASPIIIDGKPLGHFVTSQFFLEKPDLEFFKNQAVRFGFDEKEYLEAVEKVPIWTEEKLHYYLDFLKGFIEIIADIGLKNLKEIETNKKLELAHERLQEENKERRHAETAWNESSQFNKQVINSAQEGIIVYDLNLKYLVWNPFMEKMSGIPASEVLGKYPLEVFPFLKDVGMIEILERALKGEINEGIDFPFEVISTGRKGWNSDRTAPLRNSKNEIIGVISTVRDITERKLSEKALLKSEEQLKAIFENSLNSIMIADDQGNYLKVNKAAAEMFNYPVEKMLQMNVGDLKTNNSPDAGKRYHDYVTKGYEIGEFDFVRSDGSLAIAQYHAVRVRENFNLSILSDITERKKIEKALSESENKLRSIYNVAPIGIGIIVDRVIKDVNPLACELTGYSREELIEKNARILYPSQEEYEYVGKEKYDQIREKGTGSVETLWQSKDGIIKNIHLFSTPINIKDISKGCIFTALDITARKQNELELEKHRNHLEELVKLRTEELEKANELLILSVEKEHELSEIKSRFISTTSHEFRTPLTSVRSSTELLQRFGKKWSDEKQSEHFNRILSSVDYLTHLLDEILTLNRAESGKISYNPETIDLLKFSEGCLLDAKLLMTDLHELIFSYKLKQKEFQLDPKLMRFILSNLLSNAAKYSPHGGNVELKISKDNRLLTIEVSDEGIGIQTEDLHKIFDSFYRTKHAEEIHGTGLGLAIVKRAVELHNGVITVESELGKGTTFTVKIPINNK